MKAIELNVGRFQKQKGGKDLTNKHCLKCAEEDTRTRIYGHVLKAYCEESEPEQHAAVKIIMDRETGKARGFAFVDMPDREEASKAIEGLNSMEFLGRSLTVNEAKPRS